VNAFAYYIEMPPEKQKLTVKLLLLIRATLDPFGIDTERFS